MISLWQFGKIGCHDELFNQIKGMKMVRNNKMGAGMALVAALLGMGVSGTASALPEIVIGSHLAQDASTVNAVAEPVDQASTDEIDSVSSDEDAPTASD
jgi:hypothetical protein